MIAGRYELGREIGRGGMGAVWLARDTTLSRDVAVKRLGMTQGGSSEDLERAEREARLAARLNHAHVVHVFDLVTDDEGQWLVMEYVDGRTLAQLVRDEGALPHDRASALLGQAADALAAAHEAGIVHRDVKPSNMLVSSADEVKLSDFGIAKAEADPSLTQTGLVTGSPAYLSPEVASGHMATSASDVWSLGAALFHALSGHAPYEVGENLMGTLFKIVHEDPPRLEDAGWLAPLLEHTMTREPDDRWSMAQVRDFLVSGGAEAPLPAEATQVMAAPVLAPPPPEVATPEQPLPVVDPEPGEPDSHRRRSALPLVAAGMALLVLLVVAWFLLTGDDDGATPTIDRPRSSDRASEPTDGESTSTAAQPTEEEMQAFISDYLATAPSSPETTYEQLTPAFQQASGGLEGYSGFWSTIASAEPLEISADPESLVVDYTVAYTRQDGSETTDSVSLLLEYRDGQYRIADEA